MVLRVLRRFVDTKINHLLKYYTFFTLRRDILRDMATPSKLIGYFGGWMPRFVYTYVIDDYWSASKLVREGEDEQ